MKKMFFKEYKHYCKAQETIYVIFQMIQREDEALEGYVGQFQFSLQRVKKCKLDPEPLKMVFLRGVQKDSIQALNLMDGGEISQNDFNAIIDLYRNQ